MKKLVIVLLILSILIVWGCTSKEKSRKIELEFWHAMGGPLGDALTKLVEEFNDTHPDIFINDINMGNYTALSQKLMAAIVAKTQPDLAQAYEAWIAKFIDGNALVPIEKFIKGPNGLSQEELNDFYPVFIKSSTFNDTMYAFPFNKSVRVMYYNKDMFYRNGLDIEKPPATWDEFIAVGKKLTQDRDGDGKLDQWGTTFATNAWQFENCLLEAGGQIMNEDLTEPLFNSKYGVEAMDFLSGQLNKSKIAYLSTGYDGQNDFLASKVGMVEGSSVSMVYLHKGGIPFNLGMAAVPYFRTKKSLVSGTNIVIFKNDTDTQQQQKQEACWEFIKWFTSPKQTAQWSNMTYYMPVRMSAIEDEETQAKFKKYPGLKSVFDQLLYAEVEPQTDAWFETRKLLEEQVIEKVFRNQVGAQKALNDLADKMRKILRDE
jgi:multiple sugar transport system substrate-binding protein